MTGDNPVSIRWCRLIKLDAAKQWGGVADGVQVPTSTNFERNRPEPGPAHTVIVTRIGFCITRHFDCDVVKAITLRVRLKISKGDEILNFRQWSVWLEVVFDRFALLAGTAANGPYHPM